MPWRAVNRTTRQVMPQPSVLRQPDPFQPRETTLAQLSAAMLIRGEAFAWLTAHDRSGRATVAIPVPNDEVSITWDDTQRFAVYRWRGQVMTLGYDLMHLKYQDLGPGYLHGVGPIQAIAGTIAGNLNADRLTSTQFTEGAWVDGVLEAPNKLTKAEADRLREQWDTAHAGKRGTAVLEGGIAYKPVMMSNSDAQLLESRKFYATDIARAYGIPAPLLGLPMGEGSSLTYANLADIKSQYAQFAVQVVTDSVEAQFSRLLPSTQECLFAFSSLLRADISTRYSVYSKALDAGLLTVNEARELEGLPPLAGGDEIRAPKDTQQVGGGDATPTPAQQDQVNA
jgi:HK97 family phage portal protein